MEKNNEYQKTQDNLLNSEAKLNLALKAAHMGAWIFDLEENKRYFDDQVCSLLGLNPNTFSGTAEEFYATVHPDDQEKIKIAINKTISQGIAYKPEFRVIWPDKSIHEITARGELVSGINGNSKLINGIAWDITERKKMEKSLFDAEIRYRTLFEQSPDGIVIIDPETANILEFNETACEQLGYSHEEFLKLNIADIDISETREETKKRIKKVIHDGRNDFETLHRTKQGKTRNIHVTAQNIDILGDSIYYCTWRDITEQKKGQLAIENFLHILTHDLRGPLGPVLGFSDLIQDADLPLEEIKKFAGFINENGKKILNLIESYLLLLKIELGQAKLIKKPKNIFEIMEEIKKTFSVVKNYGSNLRVLPISPGGDYISTDFVNKKVSIDEVLFSSLLSNLLQNAAEEAVKTDRQVLVNAYNNHDCLCLNFSNCGEIPDEIRDRLFQKFVTGKTTGTGIGLYSAKLIAEAHGWEIIYQPSPGKTCFVVKIPYEEKE